MPNLANPNHSRTSQNSSHAGKSLLCFKQECEFRAHAMSLILRHAKIVHKLNYCRNCCDFYDDVITRYCPSCQLFCMSPDCFHAAYALNEGTALSQRHRRTPHCPTVRGKTTGVPEEQLLDYLRRLDQERESKQVSQPQAQPREPSTQTSLDFQNSSNDSIDTDYNATLSPVQHYGVDIRPDPNAALYMTEFEDNTAQGAVSSYRATAQTLPPNNAQLPHDTDLSLLDDDLATWVWDGVYR